MVEMRAKDDRNRLIKMFETLSLKCAMETEKFMFEDGKATVSARSEDHVAGIAGWWELEEMTGSASATVPILLVIRELKKLAPGPVEMAIKDDYIKFKTQRKSKRIKLREDAGTVKLPSDLGWSLLATMESEEISSFAKDGEGLSFPVWRFSFQDGKIRGVVGNIDEDMISTRMIFTADIKKSDEPFTVSTTAMFPEVASILSGKVEVMLGEKLPLVFRVKEEDKEFTVMIAPYVEET